MKLDGTVDAQVQVIRRDLFGHLTPDELPTLDEQTEMVRREVVRRHGIDAWRIHRNDQARLRERKPYWTKQGDEGRGARQRRAASVTPPR